MRTRALACSLVSVGSLLVLSNALAKTASCPCSPCKCSPCTCGGGGSKSSSGKHHDKEHGHDHHGGSSVGVGVNVDLSGVGQRSREPDPFAAGGGQPVAHTQERHKPKAKEPVGTFDEIKLTGIEGKDQNMPPGPINVSDEMLTGENDPIFTREDFNTLLKQYKQLRERFVGLPPPPENLDRFVSEMRIAINQPPRHFIQWLLQHPEELAKIVKAWGTQLAADDNYNKAIWKFDDLHKEKYDAIFDPENRSTAVHEDFDATPEGKKLGDALWNANGALQDAWNQALANEGAGQSVPR